MNSFMVVYFKVCGLDSVLYADKGFGILHLKSEGQHRFGTPDPAVGYLR